MPDKTTSELELTDIIRSTKNDDTAEKVTMQERLKKFLDFFTVEPFLFCYILPSIIVGVATQNLNMVKACQADLGYPESICENVVDNCNENDTVAACTESQKLVANMLAWSQPLQSSLPAIVILFVGAWSDKTGNRKALMLIPILGEIVSCIGLILATYFTHWPLWFTGLIESVPSALSGGMSIALMGSYSYLADVTSVDSRTFRLGLVGIIVTLGVPLGSSISGILVTTLGYYGVFSLGIVLYALGFLQTYFRVHDVKHEPLQGTFFSKVIQFFHPMNAWDTFSIVILSRGKKLLQILLIIFAHIVVIGPVFGEGPLLFYYLTSKYEMSVVDFSLFTTYSVLMGIVGTSIAVTLFSKILKMHDAIIGTISTTSKILGSFFYGLAPTTKWVYFSPILDIFGNSGTAIVRSLGTKVVEPDQVGKMCSLIGFVEAVIPVIYTPIYSQVYSSALDTFPGAHYLLGGAMTVPALFIFITLYIMHRREQKDVVKDPQAKEMHAHENDTVL
ncbi:unnamed protein product [Leptosia nina]|uniref:Proton-coupled folate transporter n=1 Tax=Leptosia nina TaxID=320188 RepID=A0AAV1JTC5_9NEOP